jgi:nucleotide-binding universal stress UspA family protein
MAHALALAERFDAAIDVLHVIDTRRYDTSIESAVEPLAREGERYVERLAETAADADVPVATAVEVGRPARRVLAYVDEHGVDLVVLGRRDEGGLSRRLLGSVTQYVVTHADVPVHVVPAVDGDER